LHCFDLNAAWIVHCTIDLTHTKSDESSLRHSQMYPRQPSSSGHTIEMSDAARSITAAEAETADALLSRQLPPSTSASASASPSLSTSALRYSLPVVPQSHPFNRPMQVALSVAPEVESLVMHLNMRMQGADGTVQPLRSGWSCRLEQSVGNE